MKNIFRKSISFLSEHFSSLASTIGAILTVYFALFYVPDYIEEIERTKQNIINEELIFSIEEMVFNEVKFDSKDLELLIQAKEIKYNSSFAYTQKELLLQVLERIQSNRYIPLEKRIELTGKLKSTIEQTIPQARPNTDQSDLISTLISIIGVILGFLGFVGTLLDYRKRRLSELQRKVQGQSEKIESDIKNQLDFETLIKDILKEFNLNLGQVVGRNKAFDFILNSKSKKIAISVIFSEDELKFDRLIEMLNRNQFKDVVLVSNEELSRDIKEKISEVKKKFSINIQYLLSEDKDFLVEHFKKIFEIS